ncbi:MAG: hypothetical protein EBT93_17155, partial [Alphaproteobacteria bacterium]|nr:hypothetical protein [Alphaproteobacteria bacterium]
MPFAFLLSFSFFLILVPAVDGTKSARYTASRRCVRWAPENATTMSHNSGEVMSSFLGNDFVVFALTLLTGVLAYQFAVRKVLHASQAAQTKPHSLVRYYGIYAVIWTLVPALLLALVWAAVSKPLLMNAAEARLMLAYPNLPESFVALKL